MFDPLAGLVVVESELRGDKVLWRYMDFPSFVGMLSGRSIYLRRGDCFSDKYEGAFTASVKERIEKNIASNKLSTTYLEFKERLRQRVFINCWHDSMDDSMAMWALYGRGALSVAVTTTIARLQDSLVGGASCPVYIKKVKYIKHWRNPKISVSPYSNVFRYKAKAYSFEKEIRVIADRMYEESDGDVSGEVFGIEVSLDKLIRSVVVSPEAPEWFRVVVNDVVAKFGLDASIVKRSKLSLEPI